MAIFQVNPENILNDMNELTKKAENLQFLLNSVQTKVQALTTQGWIGDAAMSYYNKIAIYVSSSNNYIDEIKKYLNSISRLAENSQASEQEMLKNIN